jgi:SAM-dependent methyltransferase
MAGVEKHYDNLLAPYYSWISGGSELKLAEYRNFFRDHGVRPAGSGVAVDLGAGSGFQSIPLAELGFKVIALDTSRNLLAELKENAGQLPIVTVKDNLLDFARHSPAKIELVVCMGDTLTHLQSLDEVRGLIEDIYPALNLEGLLILSFRDMTDELTGLDRFIPVRSDPDKIFTCFLEFERDHVRVNDIFYEKFNEGWRMRKSFFKKLRISQQWTKKCLQKAGFKIELMDEQNGMVLIFARKR